MALPQRRDPNEERRFQDVEHRRTVETEPAGGGFGWWWLWLLIIIAIIWFAGWGWGGYGGWWWGRPGRVAPAANVGTTGTNGAATNGTTNRAAIAPTGQGVAILNATNKAPFIGQRVDIRDVQVNNKVDNHALWVGNTNGNNVNGGNVGGVGVGANAAGVGANAGTNGAGANAGNTGAGAGTGANNAGGSGAAANGAATAEIPTLVVLTGAANANGGGGNNAKNATPNNTVNGSLHSINNGELVNVTGTVEKAPPANVAKKEFGIGNDAAKRLEQQGAYIRATEVMTAQPQH